MNDYFMYKGMRAKNGQGVKKAELLEKFRMAEMALCHSVILCSGGNPRQEWIDQKEQNKKEIAELRSAIEETLIVKG